jgi:hypothetical protein
LLSRERKRGEAQGFAAIASALANDPNAIVALETLRAQERVAGSVIHCQGLPTIEKK